MRDQRPVAELRAIFDEVVAKHPGTKLTFHGWLKSHGKVHSEIKAKR